jgi:prepilin-type N-terminal cleavage/methylation domain-containing protein
MKKGFTLLEFIIIIALIGIFAAIFIPITGHFIGPPSEIYVITHRHNDGTTKIYKSYQHPWKPTNDAGLKVYTIEGQTVWLNGDIVIEIERN